jgi:hypothetical protein
VHLGVCTAWHRQHACAGEQTPGPDGFSKDAVRAHADPVFNHPRDGAAASFWNSFEPHASLSDVVDSVHSLEWQLRAVRELLRPGFMALRALRHGDRVVDFAWNFASAGAGRVLGRDALGLYGKRLRVVLAGQGGEALFVHYGSVVELGTASATKQVHRNHGGHDTYRHGAVRVGDGVAVTLINVSAAHRAHAIGLALHAQEAMRLSLRAPHAPAIRSTP